MLVSYPVSTRRTRNVPRHPDWDVEMLARYPISIHKIGPCSNVPQDISPGPESLYKIIYIIVKL